MKESVSVALQYLNVKNFCRKVQEAMNHCQKDFSGCCALEKYQQMLK